MKKTISLAILLLATSCSKSPEQQKTSPSENSDWKSMATPHFSWMLPPDWQFVKNEDDSGNLKTWFAGPQIVIPGIDVAMAPDKIIGIRNNAADAKKTLAEIVGDAEEVWKKSSSSPGRLLGRPSTARLGSAKCIAYRIENRAQNCNNVNPMTNRRNLCFEQSIFTACRDHAGDLYQFHSNLGRYLDPGKPTKEVVDLGRTIEKILSSIEFTQG